MQSEWAWDHWSVRRQNSSAWLGVGGGIRSRSARTGGACRCRTRGETRRRFRGVGFVTSRRGRVARPVWHVRRVDGRTYAIDGSREIAPEYGVHPLRVHALGNGRFEFDLPRERPGEEAGT